MNFERVECPKVWRAIHSRLHSFDGRPLMTTWLTITVGIVQVALGCMGVYVSLRPPKKNRHWYWFAGFVAIGVVGVGFTVWLERESDNAQKKAIEAVTGGNSYPEAEVLQNSTDPPKIFLTIRLKKAEYPGSVKFKVIELDPTSAPEPCYNWEPGTGTVRAEGETGPIQPGGGPPQHIISLAPPITGTTNYRIRLEAKNGVFVQCLSLRSDATPTNGHKWSQKSAVWLGQFVESSRDWGT